MRVLQSGRTKAFVFLAIGIVGGSLAAGPLPPAFAKVFAGQQGVQPHIVFTSNSGAATIKAINNGTGPGIISQAVSAPGIFGQSVSGGGIVGSSTSGYGLTGTSSTNIGLNGTSTSNSGVSGGTHAAFPIAGVAGTSFSSASNAVGVYGEQGATGIGTLGTCAAPDSGYCIAIDAESQGTNGSALTTFSFNHAPAPSYTPAPMVLFDQVNGGPVMQVSVVATAAPVLAIDGNGRMSLTAGNNANPLTVFSSGSGGDAIDAFTGGIAGEELIGLSNGTGATVQGFAAGGGPAALVVEEFSGAPVIIAKDCSGCGCDVMSLDSGGNLITSGTITASGTPLLRTRTITGRPVITYAPQQSEPTVEDIGQAQLVNGQATVHLDPSFANTMNQQSSYLVFITPDGDSRGLYTTHKTPGGFVVRENGGGHSTLAFDYRIVGKPFGNTDARLPVVAATRVNAAALAEAQRVRYAKLHPNLPRAYRVTPLPKHIRHKM